MSNTLTLSSKQNESISIFCTNIRSVHSNFHLLELYPFLYKHDIIILNECWIHGYRTFLPPIKGYLSSSFVCPHNKSCGLAIYHKNISTFEIIDKFNSFDSFDILVLWLKSYSIYIISIYRHPSSANIDNFLIELDFFICDFIYTRNIVDFVILGDVNIDLNKSNTQSSKYEHFM